MTQLPVYIRWMIRRDVPAVLAIERSCFGEHAWTEEDLVKELRSTCIVAMVAEDPQTEAIVGYFVYELRKHSLEVLNLATHPGERRRGVGRQMVDKLLGKLAPGRRCRLVVRVRESNLLAQLFFAACGLRCVSIERDCFDDSDDDGYLFVRRVRNRHPQEACS